MAISAVLNTTFNLGTKKFNFTDASDYVGESIALADVTGAITITYPDGTVRSGSHSPEDIDPDTALTNNTINLPLDVSNNVQEGDYIITYEIIVTGATQPGTYSTTYTANLCDESPTLDLKWTVDCLCAIIQLQDVTSYGSNWTVDTRELDLFFPSELELAKLTTAGTLLDSTGNDIYVGTYTGDLEVTVSRVYTTHTVTNDLRLTEERKVDCDFDACSLYCCLETAYNRWQKALTNNGATSELTRTYRNEFEYALELVVLIDRSATCGQNEDVNTYVTKFRSVLDCDEDCGCGTGTEDGQPKRIEPICNPSGTNLTFLSGNGLTVSVAGSTITYSIDAATWAKISALNTYTFNDSATIDFTVVTNTYPTPNTVTADYIGTTASQTERTTQRVEMTWGGGGPTFNVTNKTIEGTTFDNTVQIIGVDVAANPGTWQVLPAAFYVDQFSLSGVNFKAQVEIDSYTINGTTHPGYDYQSDALPMFIQIFNRTEDGGTPANNSFSFRIVTSDGLPWSFGAVQTYLTQINFSIILQS